MRQDQHPPDERGLPVATLRAPSGARSLRCYASMNGRWASGTVPPRFTALTTSTFATRPASESDRPQARSA